MSAHLESLLTCPHCGVARTETMPTDACQYFYECTGCGILLKPRPGDCCVFCSYGSVPCPPIQESRGAAACSPRGAGEAWQFCSLDGGAFTERMAEIGSTVARFRGQARPTSEGMELVFAAQDGLRSALDTLIEKERECCETLGLTVEEREGAVSLRIAARDCDRPAIQAFATRLAEASVAGKDVGCCHVSITSDVKMPP